MENKQKKCIAILLLSPVLSLLMHPGQVKSAVLVEEVAPGEVRPQETIGLDKIFITAQQRVQNQQTVPIAISTLDESTLINSGINDLLDLQSRVPGLNLGLFNLGQPQVYIRGIGSNEDGAGGDNSVVVFVDGVYVGRAAGSSMDWFDLERVEVLRGPQGTLMGKNVVGGAILLVSRQPTDTFYSSGDIIYGNLDYRSARAIVSGPLSDRVFAKVAAGFRMRQGYTQSAVAGHDYNDIDSRSLRGQLRVLASDNLSINLIADGTVNRQNSPGHRTIGGQVGDAFQALDPVTFADQRKNFGEREGKQDRDLGGLTLRADWAFLGRMLTSISAFRMSDYRFDDEALGTNAITFPANLLNGAVEKADQYSQEWRLASSGDRRLHWVTGLYWLRESIEREEYFLFNLPPSGALAPRDLSQQQNRTESAAVFAQMDFGLTERLTLTLGARYTDERKTLSQAGVVGALGAGIIAENYAVEGRATYSALTPKLALAFQASDDVMLYGSASKGFKSGGFQGQAPTGEAAETPFNQEIAWAYELGVKSELLERTLRFNAAVFHTDYRDLQVLQQLPAPEGSVTGPLNTSNAAQATSRGLETELQWRPRFAPNLMLRGHYAWLDATFERYAERPELRGNRLRNAPRNTYHLAASYRWPLVASGHIDTQFELRYQDRMYQDVENLQQTSISPYRLTNARLAYTPIHGQWEVALWGENVFNKEYLIHNYGSPTGTATTAVITVPGSPRTFGTHFRWFVY